MPIEEILPPELKKHLPSELINLCSRLQGITSPTSTLIDTAKEKTLEGILQIIPFLSSKTESESNRKSEKEKYAENICEVLEKAIGKIKTLDQIKIEPRTLKDYFTQGQMPPEVLEHIDKCCGEVLAVVNKPDMWNWDAFGCAMIGLTQLSIGVTACVVSGGALANSVGNFLISEGISDMTFAAQNGLNGTFSWEAYGAHKKESIKFSLISAACGAFGRLNLAGGVSRAIIAQVIMKQIAMHALEAVISVGLSMSAEKLAEQLSKEIFEHLKKDLRSNVEANQCYQLAQRELRGYLYALYQQKGENAQTAFEDNLRSSLAAHQAENAVKAVNYLTRGLSVVAGQLGKMGGRLNAAGSGKAKTIVGLSRFLSHAVSVVEVSSAIHQIAQMAPDLANSLKKELPASVPPPENNSEFESFYQACCESLTTQIVGSIQSLAQSALLQNGIQSLLHFAVKPLTDRINKSLSKELRGLEERAGTIKQTEKFLNTVLLQDPYAQHPATQQAKKKLTELNAPNLRRVDFTKDSHIKFANTNGLSLEELAPYGEKDLYVLRRGKQYFLVRPDIMTYASGYTEGGLSGNFDLHVSAEHLGLRINVAGNPKGVSPNMLAAGFRPLSNRPIIGEVTVHTICDADHPRGHFTVSVQDSGQTVTFDVPFQPGMPPDICLQLNLYAAKTYLKARRNNQSHEQSYQAALSKAKSSDKVKNFMENLANTIRNSPQLRHIYYQGAQEWMPSLRGGGTKKLTTAQEKQAIKEFKDLVKSKYPGRYSKKKGREVIKEIIKDDPPGSYKKFFSDDSLKKFIQEMMLDDSSEKKGLKWVVGNHEQLPRALGLESIRRSVPNNRSGCKADSNGVTWYDIHLELRIPIEMVIFKGLDSGHVPAVRDKRQIFNPNPTQGNMPGRQKEFHKELEKAFEESKEPLEFVKKSAQILHDWMERYSKKIPPTFGSDAITVLGDRPGDPPQGEKRKKRYAQVTEQVKSIFSKMYVRMGMTQQEITQQEIFSDHESSSSEAELLKSKNSSKGNPISGPEKPSKPGGTHSSSPGFFPPPPIASTSASFTNSKPSTQPPPLGTCTK